MQHGYMFFKIKPCSTELIHECQNLHRMPEAVGFAGPQAALLRSFYARLQGQAFMMSFLQLVWFVMIAFALA